MQGKNGCPVLKFYKFIGKKWTYPILINLKENKTYSFEELIHITNRKISRSILSNFLNNAIKFKLIKKTKKGYILTNLGEKYKNQLYQIRPLIFESLNINSNTCTYNCIIDKSRI